MVVLKNLGAGLKGLKFESRHLEGCGLHDRVSVQHKALESLEELMLEKTLVRFSLHFDCAWGSCALNTCGQCLKSDTLIGRYV